MARAVRQKDLEVAKADIEMADLGINSHSENPNVLAMSAYHLGQAIEKSLKAIIRAERPDLYKQVDRDGKPVVTTSHKIDMLLTKAEICRNGITAAHKFIAENATALSDFNNLRYGKMQIAEKELAELSKAAKEIVGELETEFLKANPDAELNKQNLQHEWDSRSQSGLMLSKPPDAPKVHKSSIEKEIEEQAKRKQIQNNRSNNKKSGKKPYRKNNGSYSKNHGKNYGNKKEKGDR